MAPGQVTKRTRSQSLTVETTTGVPNTTNNRVVTSTSSIPVSISNVEASHVPSTSQVNQSVPSSMPANESLAEGGSSSKNPCRGPTRGIGLVKRNEVARNKLKFVVDVELGRPLNRIQSAKLSNELGQIARDYMPCPIKYSKFSEEEKNRAWERLLMRLDVVNFREDPRVFQSVENIFKVRCRNYKQELHKEFMEYNSTTEAKLHIPKGLTQDNWNELCDYWSKGDVQVKCMINSWCRTQQKMPHNQGSAAFRQKEEGGFMPDRIALFKVTRCKNGKWTTHEAEENYQKMISMLETSTSEGNTMTADQVYDVLMGKRSGYIKGMGYGPKPLPSRSSQANTFHLEEQMKATMTENSQLKMKFQQYEELLAALAAERYTQD